jgi:hypothetical protein
MEIRVGSVLLYLNRAFTYSEIYDDIIIKEGIAILTNFPKEFSFLKRVQGDSPTIGGS